VDRDEAHKCRIALIARLEREKRPDLAQRLRRCGIPTALVCRVCRVVHHSLTRCKNKWCPACQRYLATVRAERIRFAVAGMKWPLFVTLTQGNLITITEQDVRAIRRAFGKLRNRDFWKRKVRGGVAAFEVTNIGNGWHLHLHAVIDCDWLSILSSPPKRWNTAQEKAWKVQVAKSELQEAWRQCLKQGDDPIIHVKRVDSDIVSEVVKYTIKGDELLDMADEIAPLIDAMDGTRMMTTFGNCYRLAKRLEEAEGVSEFLCPNGHAEWLPEGVASRLFEEWSEQLRKGSRKGFRQIAGEILAGDNRRDGGETKVERRIRLEKERFQKAAGLPKEAVMKAAHNPAPAVPARVKAKLRWTTQAMRDGD
jgi:hypothetical protein